MEPALVLIPLPKQDILCSNGGGFETCNLCVIIPPAYKLVSGLIPRTAVVCGAQTLINLLITA
ncbi:MAG: hypothetical protein ACLFQA_07520 [Bacteroidales bacterium]